MKIEAGKYYANRRGDVFGPLQPAPSHGVMGSLMRWKAGTFSWADDGSYFNGGPDSVLDLMQGVSPAMALANSYNASTAASEPLCYPRIVEEAGEVLLKVKSGGVELICNVTEGQQKALARDLLGILLRVRQ